MPLQLPNLDDRRYKDLMEEARGLIPTYAPDWTNHNPSDPGITLVELFAWLAEMQIYRLNRITGRQYRKFLKLIGAPHLKPAQPASVEVTFTLRGPSPAAVPRGTAVAARDPQTNEDVLFETVEDLRVEGAALAKIFTYRAAGSLFVDNTTANENERAYFPVFGDDPAPGDALYLGFTAPVAGPLTMVFSLVDSPRPDYDPIDVIPSARLLWQAHAAGGWIACGVSDGTSHLSGSGAVTLSIPETMTPATVNGESLYWIRCLVEEAGYETAPRVERLQFNTVTAVQRTALKTAVFSSSGLPDFFVQVDDVPIIEDTLQVIVQGEDWNAGGKGRVEDFDASNPEDKHFTADLDSGRITFGNGMRGRIPPRGQAVTIKWKAGGGDRGSVHAGAVRTVIGAPADLVTVENKQAARGGRNAESLAQAISRARTDLATPARAVTAADFEFHALNILGLRVARARALPEYHPNRTGSVPGVVTVIVVPDGSRPDPSPSRGFMKTVQRHLDAKRLLATELFVIPPQYVKVSVSATVVIRPQYKTTTVAEKVGRALDGFLHPLRGGEDGAGWTFGRPVYLSEIYQVIDGVEGVDYVRPGTVVLSADGSAQPGDAAIPVHGLVCPAAHAITAEE
jgi:predicted phage baseplate assembly protein